MHAADRFCMLYIVYAGSSLYLMLIIILYNYINNLNVSWIISSSHVHAYILLPCMQTKVFSIIVLCRSGNNSIFNDVILTCEMFQWWLMAATGSVATEHPQPMIASFTGALWIP